MIETATFVCSICNETSLEICIYCTKDTCRNHRCERCKRCSDCCECEVHLVEPARGTAPVEAEPQAGSIRENEPLEPVGEMPGPDTPSPFNPPAQVSSEPEAGGVDILPALPEASEEPDLNVPSGLVSEQILEAEREAEHGTRLPDESRNHE